MKRWPPEVEEALRPTGQELDRLADPGPAPAWCAEATQPSALEVERLLARARQPLRRPLLRRPVLAAALALLALLAWLWWPRAPELPVGTTASLPAQGQLLFGPSIQVSGDGRIQVLRSDEQGAELELLAGHARFEIDPAGPRRQLSVRAAQVRIQVTGTIFTVERQGPQVAVAVERGAVRVQRPEGGFQLLAGERWHTEGTATARDLATHPELAIPPATVSEPDRGAEARLPDTVSAPVVPAQPEALSEPLENPQPAVEVEIDPQRAARAYAALLSQQDRDPEAQLAEIEAFLEAYDASPLAAEAALLRLQQLPQVLPAEEVLTELDRWLASHGDAGRALEVHYLRATLAREELGDCALALPSYEQVAAQGRGQLRQRAEEWAAVCAEELR